MSQSRVRLGRHERRIWGWGGVAPSHDEVRAHYAGRILDRFTGAKRNGAAR